MIYNLLQLALNIINFIPNFRKNKYPMNQFKKFIIIDDDVSNNYLCKYIIHHVAREAEIIDFVSATAGLDYISASFSDDEEASSTVLFLDIKMPIMDGWDFLEKFDLLPNKIKDSIMIYILTSSIDSSDRIKADENTYVKNYVVKPLTKGTVHNILAGLM